MESLVVVLGCCSLVGCILDGSVLGVRALARVIAVAVAAVPGDICTLRTKARLIIYQKSPAGFIYHAHPVQLEHWYCR